MMLRQTLLAITSACTIVVAAISPVQARFLQRDPVGYQDDLNLYTYVRNEPIDHADPSGEMCPGECPEQVQATYQNRDSIVAAGGRLLDAIDPPQNPDHPVAQMGLGGARSALGRAAATLERRLARAELRAARAAQLERNAAQGRAGEAATRARLGDSVAGEQVTFETSTGSRARVDFVTRDGVAVESKTGGATLSQGQQDLQADVQAGRSVTPRGDNASSAGYDPDVPTRLNGSHVDRHY